METTKVAKGAFYIAIQNVIQYMALFLFYVGIVRVLPQADVGKISLLTFVMGLFNVFTQLAIPVASQKFVSENLGRGQVERASAVAKTALKIILSVSLPSLMLVLLISPWLSTLMFGTEANTPLLMVVFTTSFMLNFTVLFGADMLGLGMFAEMAVQNLTFVITGRAISIVLAWLGYGVNGVVTGWLIGAVLCLVVSFILLRGRLPHSSENFPARVMLAYSSLILISAIIGLLQGWADVTLLYALTSSLALTGIYYLAMAGANVISILWTAVTTTIFPAISAQYGKTGPEGVKNALHVSTRQLNIMVIPVSISLAAVSQTAIQVAYGSGYLTGTVPFALLTLTSIIPAYATLFTVALQAIGETRVLIKIGALSALTDIFVMLLLARSLGVMGTAIARIAMFTTVLTLSYRALKTRVDLTIDVSSLRKGVLLSATMATPLAIADWTFIHIIPLNLLTKILVEGAMLMGVGLIAAMKLKPLEKGDIKLLKQAIPKQLHGILNLVERILT